MKNIGFQEKIKNYSFEQALNELLANKGHVVDLKLEIEQKKKELKRLEKALTLEKENELFEIKVKINQLKATKKALKTSTEFPQFIIYKKRHKLAKEIKELKHLYRIRKYFLADEIGALSESIKAMKNELKKAKKQKNTSEIAKLKNNIAKTSVALKELKKNSKKQAIASVNIKECQGIEERIADLKVQKKCFQKEHRNENILLRRKMIAQRHLNNMAQEKHEVLNLNKNEADYKAKKVELLKPFHEKYGKSLKYSFSSLAYLLMLAVILLQIIYIIVFLNDMKVNYLEFPVLIINLVITLVLFLSAMKVKVHSQFWTNLNFAFSAYLLVRILVIIPLIAHDYDAVYDGENIVEQAASYAGLRTQLIVFSAIMLALTLISSIISTKRIRTRNLYLK